MESKLWHQIALYYSNPSHPDISEIEDVCKYVGAYTGKRHNTIQEEKEAIQNIIMGYKFVVVEIFQIWKNFQRDFSKLWFSSWRLRDDNLTGLRTITRKALHMLSGQWQVSMQEAVHMVDNQEVMIVQIESLMSVWLKDKLCKERLISLRKMTW